jgi:hypothetical protein
MATVFDHLSWKWTFIGVKEMPLVQMRRSSSEPSFKGICLLDDSDPFEHDRAYVTTLGERAQKLKEPSVVSGTTQQLPSDQGSMLDSLETVSNLSKIDASSQSGEASPRSLKEEDVSAPSYHVQPQMSVSSTLFNVFRGNMGSAGHPEFCNRPCIFFPLGQCSSGKSCNHCHEAHPQKSPNLDKINRATLKSIPLVKRRHFLLAVVKERAENELPAEKLTSFLQILRVLCGSVNSDQAFVPVSQGWRENRLVCQLLKMPLITLFNLLQDCSGNSGITTSREALNQFRYSFQVAA